MILMILVINMIIHIGVPQLRFVCRAREGEAGKLAPVVVLCATCLDGAGTPLTIL